MSNPSYSVVLQYVDWSGDKKLHRYVTRLAYIPTPGHYIVKDGKKYRVEEVVYNLDILEISITMEEI